MRSSCSKRHVYADPNASKEKTDEPLERSKRTMGTRRRFLFR